MSTTIVAFTTRKGGVGKTTCATGFAAIAASSKRKTLLIDLDQEGHATFGIGAEVVSLNGAAPENRPGSADFLLGRGVPVQTVTPFLDVLAGNSDLEDPAIGRLEPEALADAIATLDGRYEVIVIDCPPNTHELSKLGTVAAQTVFIPIDAHPYAINCATRLIADLAARRGKGRSGATRWAIVANRIDLRRRLDAEVMAAAKSLFEGIRIFKVSQDTALSNCSNKRELLTRHVAKTDRAIVELSALVKWADATTA